MVAPGSLTLFGYSFKIKSIKEIGTLNGTKYKGIKFEQISPNGKTRLRSLEWHNSLHNGIAIGSLTNGTI